jgi:hypothetical protein
MTALRHLVSALAFAFGLFAAPAAADLAPDASKSAKAAASGAIAPAAPVSDWELCHRHIRAAERLLSLPKHLLTAISRTESGRWSKQHRAHLAWPWTVMAEGKGRYLPSKAAAIAEVRALKAKGVGNIDVGCMQINLHFHPDAFESLEQAFDPAFNVAYAASFLTELRASQNSWTRAIGRYHSATPHFANRYRAKVFKYWNEEKRLAAQAAREARRAAREGAQPEPEAEATEGAKVEAAGAADPDARLASLERGTAPGGIR